jgi:hypothetical protein
MGGLAGGPSASDNCAPHGDTVVDNSGQSDAI